jgi:dTMP kinase
MKISTIKNFIVFEGLDGAGTTTQSKLLNSKIAGSFFTKEPTDGKIGLLIREILQKKMNYTKETLALLFVADRYEHLHGNQGIIQRSKDGEIIICDRYLFSSLAYQSLDIDFDRILELNHLFPIPEILFFINTPINECQKRIHTRGENEELFEKFPLQEKILDNYQRAFSVYSEAGAEIIYLDGSLPIDVLLELEIKHLKEKGII